MSCGKAPSDSTKNPPHTVYETVTATTGTTPQNGHVPVPERFTIAHVVRPNTTYFPRLYYSAASETMCVYLMSPSDSGEYTPFKADSGALFNVDDAPSHIEQRYSLHIPPAVFYGTSLSHAEIHWATTNGAPTLIIDETPAQDPIEACGPGENIVGHIDGTTVFAVNNKFKQIPEAVCKEANIIDRTHICNTRDPESGRQHALQLDANAPPNPIPDRVIWTAEPASTGRILLTPREPDTREAPHAVTPTEREGTIRIPLPRSLSNLFDIPNPRGVVWVDQNGYPTAIL